MAATGYMNVPNILGRHSIQQIFEELCAPIIINKENAVLPPKYMYIRKLIPVVLDLYSVQYTRWSTLFLHAARANNLLHHIHPTIPNPPPPPRDINIWCQQDAVLLTWIYATISPYLLFRIITQESNNTSAMNAWARLRDICQQHNTAMQKKKKRRFIHIDLNEDYDQGGGHNDNDHCVDLFSNLSDDLLIYVLSLAADIKTAGRTSLLSKRWTHVWTHLQDLDFNDNLTTATLNYYNYAQPEMDMFVNWVNRVISANRDPYLGIFRIHFPLNTSYAAHIDNWLKFAFSIEVRNLELNFMTSSSRIHFYKIFSTNPALILNTTLESLHLKSVNIIGPLLQCVIAKCLNLQRLSLHSCMASADALHKIDALHLATPNLTSFIYYECKIDVEYGSVPSLVDITFAGSYLHHLDTLSGFSSQLEKLSFLWDKAYHASSIFPTNSGFPAFTNIQQLEIVYSQQDVYLLSLTSLIEACPLMHTFKLKLMCRKQLKRPRKRLAPNNTQLKAIYSHQHLKAVEYLGYAGCAFAAELALCLTRHAPMLRRYIFDTRQPQLIGNPCDVYTSDHKDQMEIVRSTTELLAEHIRGSRGLVDVVIL